jgi:hypothetical protein
MRVKAAYRRPAPKIPAEDLDDQKIQPSETVHIDFSTHPDPAEGVAAIEPATPTPEDEATLALKRQIESLRQSEEFQRQQRPAATMPAPTLPVEPEARIALWKQHGLSDEDAAYLKERPGMALNPHLTRVAYAATLQAGVERNSPEFAPTMEACFNDLMQRAEAQARAAANPAAQPTPEFFQPPPSPAAPTPESQRAAIVSAPVSRRDVGGTRELSPSQIKLSPAEQAIARSAGISDVAYAAATGTFAMSASRCASASSNPMEIMGDEHSRCRRSARRSAHLA